MAKSKRRSRQVSFQRPRKKRCYTVPELKSLGRVFYDIQSNASSSVL